MEEEGKYNWLEIACNLQLLDSHCLSMANEFSPVSLGALLFFAVVMIEGTQWTAIFYVNVNTRLERNCFQHSRNIFIFTSTQNLALLITSKLKAYWYKLFTFIIQCQFYFYRLQFENQEAIFALWITFSSRKTTITFIAQCVLKYNMSKLHCYGNMIFI